jgi:hypothetical protein
MDLLWADMPGLRPLLGCVTRLNPMIYDPKSKVSAEYCLIVLCLFCSFVGSLIEPPNIHSTPGLNTLTH